MRIPMITLLAAALQVFCLEWIGYYDTPGTALKVVLDNNHAFVADGLKGIQILDISDPANPVQISSCETPGYAQTLALYGNKAYVADWKSGITVIDITNITNTLLIGSYTTFGRVSDIAIKDDYAYVADEMKGFSVFYLSQGTGLVEIINFPLPRGAWKIQMLPDLLFVLDGENHIWKYDITLPDEPVPVECSYGTASQDMLSNGMPMYFPEQANADSRVYGLNPRGGTYFHDINKATSIPDYYTPGGVKCITFSGDLAYVADGEAGIQILSLAQPAVQVFAPTVALSASCISITGYTALIGEPAACKVLDISVPDMPLLMSTMSTTDGVLDVCLANNSALVRTRSGVRTVKTDTTVARLDGEISGLLPGLPGGTAIQGNIACVADGAEGLKIYDISNLSAPMLKGRYDTPGFAAGVVVRDNLAFVADWLSGLQIIGISNPEAPVLVSSIATAFIASGVILHGDYIFIAEGAFGFEVVNIANPAFPVQTGRYDTPGSVSGFAVWDHFLFVADHCSRIPIYDISDPDLLKPEGAYYADGRCNGLASSEDRVFAANGDNLNIFDVSRLVKAETALKPAGSGISIFNSPNPFNPSTEIRFTLPSASHAEVSVFNAQGKRVSTLAKGNMTAGGHSIKWNASSTPSGLYLLRLETAGKSASRKIILAR